MAIALEDSDTSPACSSLDSCTLDDFYCEESHFNKRNRNQNSCIILLLSPQWYLIMINDFYRVLLRLLSGKNIARKSIPGPATTFIVFKSWSLTVVAPAWQHYEVLEHRSYVFLTGLFFASCDLVVHQASTNTKLFINLLIKRYHFLKRT